MKSLIVDAYLEDEKASERAGALLGQAWLGAQSPALLLTLAGDLGAGKTCLMRGLLRGLGHHGAVRSPTYTLLESYPVAGNAAVHHLDFYRISGWDAAEQLGFSELLAARTLVAVEWPSQVESLERRADWVVLLEIQNVGRRLRLWAQSAVGLAAASGLALALKSK